MKFEKPWSSPLAYFYLLDNSGASLVKSLFIPIQSLLNFVFCSFSTAKRAQEWMLIRKHLPYADTQINRSWWFTGLLLGIPLTNRLSWSFVSLKAQLSFLSPLLLLVVPPFSWVSFVFQLLRIGCLERKIFRNLKKIDWRSVIIFLGYRLGRSGPTWSIP